MIIEPMQPMLVREPFHRPGWVWEEKVDGWRMLAYKEGNRVRLLSRQQRDHTARFPEIAAAIAALPTRTLILDGEVAVFDEKLVSRFDHLTFGRGEVDPDEVVTALRIATDAEPPSARRHEWRSRTAKVRSSTHCRMPGRRTYSPSRS